MAQKFVREFRAEYGKYPNAMAATGYDAAGVVIHSLKRLGHLTRDALTQSISETKNYAGATGIITLNRQRDAIKPAVVLKVSSGTQNQYVLTINP